MDGDVHYIIEIDQHYIFPGQPSSGYKVMCDVMSDWLTDMSIDIGDKLRTNSSIYWANVTCKKCLRNTNMERSIPKSSLRDILGLGR